jgi:hypothetical protein
VVMDSRPSSERVDSRTFSFAIHGTLVDVGTCMSCSRKQRTRHVMAHAPRLRLDSDLTRTCLNLNYSGNSVFYNAHNSKTAHHRMIPLNILQEFCSANHFPLCSWKLH